MKNTLKSICIVIGLISLLIDAKAQSTKVESFSNSARSLNVIGIGTAKIQNEVLITKDAYACFGDLKLKDFRLSFEARAPKTSKEVQIWAGFRALNRFDRY